MKHPEDQFSENCRKLYERHSKKVENKKQLAHLLDALTKIQNYWDLEKKKGNYNPFVEELQVLTEIPKPLPWDKNLLKGNLHVYTVLIDNKSLEKVINYLKQKNFFSM